MTMTKHVKGATLTVELEGSLDGDAVAELQGLLDAELPGKERLVLDCARLSYVSPAGLRLVVLVMQYLRRRDAICILNANDEVREIFVATCFDDLLHALELNPR